ncbi:hypothetical protein OHJ21_18205 [Virgibacillus sp. LDC1]|nr:MULTISPECIES: hypothetical protein [Paenibacillus]MCV4233122.1 hypothetical protein [Virgibacillus sp. LDC1]MEC0257885.1 hypothetical protein [Paenibacillus lautus]
MQNNHIYGTDLQLPLTAEVIELHLNNSQGWTGMNSRSRVGRANLSR